MGPPLVISNGIAFSPEGRVMYFGDSGTRLIRACDYDLENGAVSNVRVFARVEAPGFPDGSTVDAEGFLWNAEYDGWRIVRYDPDGRIDRVIDLPVRQPTSCMFGGENLDVLYVTTARFEQSEEELEAQPLAGARARPRRRGAGAARTRVRRLITGCRRRDSRVRLRREPCR